LVRLEEFIDIYHQLEQVEDEDIGHIAMMLSMVDRGGRSKRPTPLKPLKRKDQGDTNRGAIGLRNDQSTKTGSNLISRPENYPHTPTESSTLFYFGRTGAQIRTCISGAPARVTVVAKGRPTGPSIRQSRLTGPLPLIRMEDPTSSDKAAHCVGGMGGRRITPQEIL
jgi:hypothetical protein